MKKAFNIRILPVLLSAVLALGACSDSSDDSDPAPEADSQTQADSTGRTLVVYYSQALPDGVDGTTGATDIIREGSGRYGANQYLAMLIARRLNADTLRLTVGRGYYPGTYDELATFARNELDNNIHPRLTSRTVNIGDYDNIVISTPVWWGTIPMPVYSFLDAYDLSGKRVFVATTHAGSGLGSAISAIRSAEPRANVSSDGLAVRASSVSAGTASAVNTWVNGLGF